MIDFVISQKDKEELIQETARRIAVMSARNAYLTRSDVATMLGYTYTGLAAVLDSPTFPRPVRLTETGQKRWKCGDILDWAAARAR